MATSNGNTPTSAGQIPVIDISGSIPQAEVAKQLVDAAATYGFVYVKNQGKDIPVEVIDGIFQLVRLSFSTRSPSITRIYLTYLSNVVEELLQLTTRRKRALQDPNE